LDALGVLDVGERGDKVDVDFVVVDPEVAVYIDFTEDFCQDVGWNECLINGTLFVFVLIFYQFK